MTDLTNGLTLYVSSVSLLLLMLVVVNVNVIC